jgi:hypothetical protein
MPVSVTQDDVRVTVGTDDVVVSLGAAQGPPGPGNVWAEDTFTPTTNQTVFSLSRAPSDALSLTVNVNGQSFTPGAGAWTLAGTTVTWVASYSLSGSDTVTIHYS